MTPTTELTTVTGDRYRLQIDVREAERIILDASRGSIMQLAWFVETDTGEEIAFNPEFIVALKRLG